MKMQKYIYMYICCRHTVLQHFVVLQTSLLPTLYVRTYIYWWNQKHINTYLYIRIYYKRIVYSGDVYIYSEMYSKWITYNVTYHDEMNLTQVHVHALYVEHIYIYMVCVLMKSSILIQAPSCRYYMLSHMHKYICSGRTFAINNGRKLCIAK